MAHKRPHHVDIYNLPRARGADAGMKLYNLYVFQLPGASGIYKLLRPHRLWFVDRRTVN